MMELLKEGIEMRLAAENQEIDAECASKFSVEVRSLVDEYLRLRIEDLCLEELHRNSNHFTADRYQQIEEMLLRIVGRITEPLLDQIREGSGGRNRQAQNLRMIADAFKLQEVRRGQ